MGQARVAVANGAICKGFSLALSHLGWAKSTLSWYPPSLPRFPSLVSPLPFLFTCHHSLCLGSAKGQLTGGGNPPQRSCCVYHFVSFVLVYCIFPLLCTCPLKMPCFVMCKPCFWFTRAKYQWAVVRSLFFFWFVASPPCGSLCAIIVHMIAQPPGPPVCLFFLSSIFPSLCIPHICVLFAKLFEAAFLASPCDISFLLCLSSQEGGGWGMTHTYKFVLCKGIYA